MRLITVSIHHFPKSWLRAIQMYEVSTYGFSNIACLYTARLVVDDKWWCLKKAQPINFGHNNVIVYLNNDSNLIAAPFY